MSNMKWGNYEPVRNNQFQKNNTPDNFQHSTTLSINRNTSEPPNQQKFINDLKQNLTNLKKQFMNLATKPSGPPPNNYPENFTNKPQQVEEKTALQFQTMHRKKSSNEGYRQQIGHPYNMQGLNGDASRSHTVVKNQPNKYIKLQNNLVTPSEIYQLNVESKFRRMPSGETTYSKNKSRQFQTMTPTLTKNENQAYSTDANNYSNTSTPVGQNQKTREDIQKLTAENNNLRSKQTLLQSRLAQQIQSKKQQFKKIEQLQHKNTILAEQKDKCRLQVTEINKQLQKSKKSNQIARNQLQSLKKQSNHTKNDKSSSLLRIKQLQQTITNFQNINTKLCVSQEKLISERTKLQTEHQKLIIISEQNQVMLRDQQITMIDKDTEIENLKKTIMELQQDKKSNILLKQNQRNKQVQSMQEIKKQNKKLCSERVEHLQKIAQLQKQLEKRPSGGLEKQLKQAKIQCGELTRIVNEKQTVGRNMLRDMKAFEKQLHDLRKIRKVFEEINMKNNEQIMWQHISTLNNKYCKQQKEQY